MRRLLVCLLTLASAAMASAQESAVAPDAAAPDLYIEAMQAISEGRSADANHYLSALAAKAPRHAGEWLDLALIHCALGHAEEAEQLFTDIERRFTPPAPIMELINQRRAQGCLRWKPASQFSVSLTRGVDRNVNQGASNPSYDLGGSGLTLELLPQYLPQADQFSMVAADYVREVNPNGATVFAQMLVRHNDRLSDYSTAAAFGGFEVPWRWGRWRLSGSAFGGLLTLGGHLYQQQGQVQMRVHAPVRMPKGMDVYAQMGLSHVRYTTSANFNSNTTDLRAVLLHRRDDSQVRVSAAILHDRASGTRPGGDRDGWGMTMNGRYRITGPWQGELDLSGQSWRGNLPYAPPLILERRRQLTLAARATLVRSLGGGQSLRAELRHVRNRENVSLFEYHDTIMQLSWHWASF